MSGAVINADNGVVKNKYLASMKNYLDFKYLGPTFWGGNLFLLTNKNDPTSKVLYAFEMDGGSKVELVNIYDGSIVRLTNYHKAGFNITTGTNYQRDIVLDLIFASFVSGIKISDKTKEVVYTYYPENIVKPHEAIFKMGDFELYVHNDNVEIFLPDFDGKIVGDFKKIPMVLAPEIQWRIENKRKPSVFYDDSWLD